MSGSLLLLFHKIYNMPSPLEQCIQTYFGVRQENLNQISTLFKATTMKKGDYFLKKGQYCDKLSFVKTGMLRIFVAMEEKEVTQWISTPGYFVTDLSSLIFETPARWTIQALTDVELYTIYKDDYRCWQYDCGADTPARRTGNDF